MEKKESVEYVCLSGKHRFKTEYRGWYPRVDCIKCGSKAIMAELAGGDVMLRKYKEPTAFFQDKKTGRMMAVDRKGNKFDAEKTRYDLKRDPYGWKATDK